MKKVTLLFVILILFSFNTAAQNDTTRTDTTDVENWEAWEDYQDFDFEFDVFGNPLKGAPTVSLSFGLAKINHKDLGSEFSEPVSLELKLGKTHQGFCSKSDKILNHRFSFIFLGNITTELSSNDDKLKSDSWRFGTGRETGYGYPIGDAGIILYNSNSFTWTRLNADKSPAEINGLMPVLERYNNAFRFGNTMEAGMKLQIIPNLALEGSYERTAVYERHLFWKWGGSILIELISQSLLDEFIEEIIDSSPYAGPIVNFLLKNALSFGIYELREEKMNWPFDSAPALMYDQFKVGLTFTF